MWNLAEKSFCFLEKQKKKQFAKLAKAVNVLKSLGCGHSRVDVVFQVQIWFHKGSTIEVCVKSVFFYY